MARFVFKMGSQEKLIYEIETPHVMIGRGSGCNLQIPDRRCSRRHAEVVRQGNDYILRDLSSKNRVFINDALLNQEHTLVTGDRVLIGDTVLVFDTGEGVGKFNGKSRIDDVDIKLVDDDSTRWGMRRGARAAGETRPPETPLEKARGEAIRDPLRRLEILYDLADKIRSILDINRLIDEIGIILREVLSPDTLVVMLRDEDTGRLRPRVLHSSAEKTEEISISRSIVDQCIDERLALLVSDAAQDERFSASESIVAHQICSAICAPMIHQGDVLGVIYADNKSSYMPYQEDELELVTGIVNQAATALVNARLHEKSIQQKRLEREMEIARSIQKNLIPRHSPNITHFDIWGKSSPAAQVGGDYFDYIPRGDNELTLAVADVSGKGVPAALLMAIMRASLRIFAENPTNTVSDIMRQLNRSICRDATDNMFVSSVVGILNTETREFTYSNAGHSYPMLFHANGQRIDLAEGGIFLGLVEESEYQVATVKLPPGSVLFFYTDGLTDMINTHEELYGSQRSIEFLKEHLTLSAREIVEGLFAEVKTFRGSAKQFDDFTFIAVKSV